MNSKNIVIAVLALTLIGAVGYMLMFGGNDTTVIVEDAPTQTNEDQMPVEPDGGIGDGAEPLPMEDTDTRSGKTSIGTSAGGTDLTAHHFGSGDTEILMIGGVHGSYSGNTADLGDELVAYFTENESVIPEGVMVTVVPTLNPDGVATGGTAGRFNANDVDLNRNFDCEWSADAVWQSQSVSGGSAPFSEPEAAALRDYIQKYDPAAAIVWFSAEGKVYPSACAGTPSNASVELAATFATAAGYPSEAEFDAYAITGDMVNWMAGEGIPAISVLLSDRTSTEWNKNRAGVEAVLNAYAQ
tara:strand:- start:8541 stop:9437 length:897 start_codon:yes stop_codon:yes gene_type:complete